jgi:hypothetical protein
MMPNGFRLAENTTNWTNGLGYWEGPKGGFALLFYTSIYAIEGNRRIVVEDHLDTSPFDKNGNISYNADWISVRWRRHLTDDELGYKLYITAVDSVRSSSEWTSIQNGDEIPLLKKIKGRGFPGTGFNIVQQDVAAPAPTNYTELPNGYIRGFYVQHVLNNSANPANIDSIMSYAWRVDDNALDITNQTRRGKAIEDTENSLEDVSNSGVKALSVYPNPVSDVLHIDSESPIVSVKVYSSTGSLVKRMDNVGKSLDTSILQPGIYTFVIQTEEENRTFRIVKK